MGTVKAVYLSKNENVAVANLKRSIISLFQYQLLDGRYVETDVAGECDVSYESLTPDVYEKRKLECRSDGMAYHSRSDRAVGVSVRSDRHAEFRVTENGLLDKIESRERHYVSLVANKNVGSTLESIISLRFDGKAVQVSTISAASIDEAEQSLRNYERVPIVATVDNECKSCAPLKAVVKTLKSDLTADKLGTYNAAVALASIIPAARRATKDEFLQILNAHTMHDIRVSIRNAIDTHNLTDLMFFFFDKKGSASRCVSRHPNYGIT